MTRDEARAVLRTVTYKPNWTIGLNDLTDALGCLEVVFQFTAEHAGEPGLTAKVRGTQALSERELAVIGPRDFLAWIERCVLALETHEMHEWLKADGVHVTAPHA